jgi:hypothetical protein
VANDATDEEDPEPTGDTTDAKVLRLLRAAPALVGYERDRLLALPECANELVVKAAHFTMGGKIREDEALDRVRAAIEDVDRKVTASLMTPHPMPGPKAAELLLSFAWTNLGKSREDWSRRKAPASSPGSDESKNADRTLEVFGEVYADRKKRDFVRAPGDERKAADVAAEAQRHAQKLHISGGEIVRHWAKGYLADKDPFVADKDHPFALFASRIGQYGLPRSPQATPKPQAPPPPEGEPGPIPRDFVDKIRTSPTDAGKEHAA